MNLQKRIFINERIRADKVRLIDENGESIGILNLYEALKIARERGLDLIQVTEKVFPPVCKILDYGKHLYALQKKEKKIKKQQKNELKGIRLRYNISPHDLETRARQTKKFLTKGNKVRIEIRLRGREKKFQDLAAEKIKKFIESLKQSIPIRTDQNMQKRPQGFSIIISQDKTPK